MAQRKKNTDTESAMHNVWNNTTRVCSRRWRGTFIGAHRMALVSQRFPARRPLASSLRSRRSCSSYSSEALMLTSLLPLRSPSIFSRFPSPFDLLVPFVPFVPRIFSSVVRSVVLLFCDGDLLCFWRGGVRGASSSPYRSQFSPFFVQEFPKL